MKHSISRKLLKNYILMFFISTLLVFISYSLLLLADGIMSKKLVSQIYTAEALMVDDYNKIQVEEVLKHKGSVQVVTKDLEVVNLGGNPAVKDKKLTLKQWSDFLTNAKDKNNQYNYSIEYNESKNFWLIVTFPVSLRIYFGIVTNEEIISTDFHRVILTLVTIILIYIIMLVISTLIYSKISAVNFVEPLRALCRGTQRLAQGNYKERLELHLTAEFAELEENFNDLSRELEIQTKLKEESENLRRRMILDVSHDLKNPLVSILGYSELCLQENLSSHKQKKYMEIIHNNSIRANELITYLFELSRIDSPDFKLSLEKIDICEFVREKISDVIPLLEDAKFLWEFNIPETEIITKIDVKQMGRVFFNLLTNAIKYNAAGTVITVTIRKEMDKVLIIVADNGIGIEQSLEKDIFNPFVRADKSRNSKTGGSGLGLTIVKKIIEAHKGTITLIAGEGKGCEFQIFLPI